MLSKEEVMRGMQLKPDVEAIFEFVGYRKNNLYEGYRPAHLIYEDCLTTGVHSYYKLENNTKGELKGTITFVSPEDYPACLWIGKQITMYEGKNVVGHATITNIFNPILNLNSAPAGILSNVRGFASDVTLSIFTSVLLSA